MLLGHGEMTAMDAEGHPVIMGHGLKSHQIVEREHRGKQGKGVALQCTISSLFPAPGSFHTWGPVPPVYPCPLLATAPLP